MVEGRTARLLEQVPMPQAVARLPRNEVGYPIPWFVAELDGGVRDFRIASADRFGEALRAKLCWVCGGRLGAFVAFAVGPMCAVNMISAEPPSHRDCAVYAAKVCPFLAVPQMRRRAGGKPEEDVVAAAGLMSERNPGVVLVWVTRSYQAFRPPLGNDGVLLSFGPATSTLWFAHGRDATRAEVLASFESGIGGLRELCDHDDDPQRSRLEVESRYQQALLLAPAETVGV